MRQFCALIRSCAHRAHIVYAKEKYLQVDGIRWLNFLRRFRLHGILADDMGLGKTMQSLAAVAAAHAHKEKHNVRL